MSAKIEAARRVYKQAKKVYNTLGKKAAGTKAGSTIRKDYAAAKKIYHSEGRALAKLTGRKSKKR